MSEVVVPDGWEKTTFSTLIKVENGYAFKSSDFVEDSDSTVPIVRMSNLKEGKIDLSESKYVEKDCLVELGRFRLESGDFMFGMSGSLSNYGWLKEEDGVCYQNQRVGRLTPKQSDKKFVSYLYLSEQVQSDIELMAAGAAQLNISGKQIESISVGLFPPLPEQQKIASILTSVDEVIEKTQSQINKLQDLKKGTMNELLTKGIGHTEFKDSPVGKIPVGWDIVELGSLCGFTQGVQIPLSDTLRKETDGYIRYLYINDFSSDKKLRFVRNEFSEKIVTTKDLVMANTGHTAGSVFRGKHGVLSNNAFKISVNEKIIPEYLYYYLTTDDYWIQIGRLFNSAGQPHVGHGNIAKLNFLCPSIYEQSEVVNILFSIEQNIEEKQRKLEQTQSLKKSLMQDLLTGKVRVTVN